WPQWSRRPGYAPATAPIGRATCAVANTDRLVIDARQDSADRSTMRYFVLALLLAAEGCGTDSALFSDAAVGTSGDAGSDAAPAPADSNLTPTQDWSCLVQPARAPTLDASGTITYVVPIVDFDYYAVAPEPVPGLTVMVCNAFDPDCAPLVPPATVT